MHLSVMQVGEGRARHLVLGDQLGEPAARCSSHALVLSSRSAMHTYCRNNPLQPGAEAHIMVIMFRHAQLSAPAPAGAFERAFDGLER
ncbi:hypothetical protein GCM10012289_12330 [Nonomuraea cavernae]|uniref:Uncharacterized protein n=1 Tax=Nonomuraea cavernae TaxID=2045107 RepID=A0A917YQC8_9ACTN|nr:hypothetical protein GCM10012289_12330 [Nonomuraea cavernae]